MVSIGYVLVSLNTDRPRQVGRSGCSSWSVGYVLGRQRHDRPLCTRRTERDIASRRWTADVLV